MPTGAPSARRLYREHPQSPVPAAERAGVRGPPLRLRSGAALRGRDRAGAAAGARGARAGLPNSGEDTLSFSAGRDGDAATPRGTEAALGLLDGRLRRRPLHPVPRRAPTARETYGAGRYLIDAAKSHDLGGDPAAGTLVLDFNFATQPSCAFDPRWACPLAPPENRLDLAIRAGERLA